MKIAIILPHFHPYVGGGETMFLTLAEELSARGHEVRVVARNVGQEFLGHRRLRGFDVWYCPWKSAFGHPFPRREDIEEHIAWCDIVHTSIFTTAPVVSRIARKLRKPSLLTIYEVRGRKWFWTDRLDKALLYFAVERFCCGQTFSAYHAISDATMADIARYRVCNGPVRRVYLASELKAAEDSTDERPGLREIFGVPAGCKTFLYYGRPGKTKGIYILEKAIRILASRSHGELKARFCLLLGQEPADLRAEFLRRIEADGIAGITIVRPPVGRDVLARCIRQADCVVVPSITEGFGFSALEACQIGAPVVHSDAGSLPEVVFGRCLSFKNRDVADLAEKLETVLREGRAAFKELPAKDFSVKRMVDGIESLYREMLATGGRPRTGGA